MTVELSNTMDIVHKSLNGTTSRRERSKIGQFFTPAMIARYMASLYEQAGPEVRILDPGAGVGVLFATLVETLVAKNHRPSIKVTAYENDKDVLPYLKNTMERCRVICRGAGILFQGEIRTEDFVASAIVQSDEGLFALRGERFTHAILNPPYKKNQWRDVHAQVIVCGGNRGFQSLCRFSVVDGANSIARRRNGLHYPEKFL